MKLIDQYRNGQTIEVYDYIDKLGGQAFTEPYFSEITEVLEETFQRVKYNIKIIYDALIDRGYHFRTRFNYASEMPVTEPLVNCEELLQQLDDLVKPFGYVPLSLKYFYRMVGSCNFTWDTGANDDPIWHLSDPLQVTTLNDLLEEMLETDWPETMEESVAEEGLAYLEFSADYYHKDNISGGQSYAIQLNASPGIDSQVLFDNQETTFIQYLRRYFENCGFLKITYPGHGNDYAAFFQELGPRLKKI